MGARAEMWAIIRGGSEVDSVRGVSNQWDFSILGKVCGHMLAYQGFWPPW